MKKNQRIIILSILSILIVITLVIGISRAFMKPVMDTDAITEVSLSSCAKIKLSGNNSINLGDSYPMSRNKGLKTTPYTFTVSSSCDSLVGFNMYIATLNTNTIDASAIHYIITKTGSKEALKEGILKDATDAEASFSTSEKNELNLGIKGTYGNIYQVFNDNIPLKGNATYDLYLFLDESVTDASTMSKTFSAGIAVKSYDFTLSMSQKIKDLYTGTQGENNLYYHDSTLENGAGDNSYRFAGSNDTTNNFVCFGTDTSVCPTDNLYRIIGVFDDQVKLIKYDYAKSSLLGTDGDYINTYSGTTLSGTNKGENTKEEIGTYCWNCSNGSTSTNTWSSSRLNKTNLNTNFISNIGTTWANKIATHTWIVGGNTSANIGTEVAPTVYKNEITSPATDTKYTAKIGLMYASDYGYSASPSAWEITIDYYDDSSVTSANWMYMGLLEWMISPLTDSSVNALYIFYNGDVGPIRVNGNDAVRPVFYLNNEVNYAGGSGTKADPYRIA